MRKEPDLLAAGSLCYLALPTFLFLGTWFEPVAGWPAFLLLAGLLLAACRRLSPFGPRDHMWGGAALFVVAMAWTLASGLGGLAHANTDWNFRYAVLRDLSVTAWPPAYASMEGASVILRAPLAYYLPAAAVGRTLGVDSAMGTLILWTALGAWIFLRLLPLSSDSLRVRWLQLVAVVLFSGMDTLGYFSHMGVFPPWHLHIEWWGQHFQYSSLTTQLFWVPNHALGAWIATALIVRHFGSDGLGRLLPLLLALLPLWSPLSAVGVLPIAFAHWGWRMRNRQFSIPGDIPVPAIAGVSLAILPILVFLAAGMQTINTETTLPGSSLAAADFAIDYALFVLLEFGLLSFLLIPRDPAMRMLFGVAVAVLMLLPFMRMGPANDIVMRASIPALLVLMIRVMQTIEREWKGMPVGRRWLLVICLTIGAVTPLREFYRGGALKPWQPDRSASLSDRSLGQLPAHYTAVVFEDSVLGRMISPVSLIPGRAPVRGWPENRSSGR